MTTSAGTGLSDVDQHPSSPSRRPVFYANRNRASFDLRSLREWLISALGIGQPLSRRAKICVAVVLFAISFSIKSIQAVDVQPYMYTPDEPARGMSEQYDHEAASIDSGRGILVPSDWNSQDTSLLVHAPGYPILLAGIYAVSGRSYFYVQLVQNLLNSLSPIILFLLVGELISWRLGIVSGFLAVFSHHFSYYSNMILPDSLCALPILIAMYLLVKARRAHRQALLYALSALMLGVSVWIRPNSLMMGVFIALMLIAIAPRRGFELRRASLLVVIPFLVVSPITLRNYLLYHRLVLVSANTGIVMLEGVANGSQGKFGPLPADDKQVAHMESEWYNDPRYAGDWSEPDGIQRDRDRVKRSLAIIIRHPFWFVGSMLGRMRDMLQYVADADLVLKKAPPAPSFSADGELELPIDPLNRRRLPRQNFIADRKTIDFCLAPGRMMNFARLPLRMMQRVTKETDELFVFLGLPALLVLSLRRAALLLTVPLYYLLIQSTLHTEFRYTLPMHYFLFVFAAAVWVLIGVGVTRGARLTWSRLLGLKGGPPG